MSKGLPKSRVLFQRLTRRFFSLRPTAMSSNNAGGDDGKCRDHMKRTASTPRHRTFSHITVSDVKNLSSTVKGITLRASPEHVPNLMFKAGQWVDMVIPGVETVGGFSICNSPEDLVKNHRLVLAVRYSKHPPAHWCNTKCKIGDRVEVRVGGDCYHECFHGDGDNNKKTTRPLLLIGGGVGVNPLLSIFMHRRDVMVVTSSKPPPTRMILTAKSREELLFEEEITSVCRHSSPHFTARYHLTQQPLPPHLLRHDDDVSHHARRLTGDDIRREVEGLSSSCQGQSGPECFICGPPPFIEWCADKTVKAGVSPRDVHYEKWW